ncbi:MAG: thioredoxin family protein [Chitinophagaceae bacterium]
MKKLLIPLLLLGIACKAKAQPAAETADAIMKEAYQLAAKDNKNVFIMFHASWCGWCHRMDNSMNDNACKKYFQDNYVIRHLVVDESKDKLYLENPGAKEMRTRYNGDGQGIPFWLVFDKHGNLLADSKMRKEGDGPGKGDNTGCPANEKEVNYFIDILKRTSSLTKDQLEIIRKRFRENDK